MGDGLILATPIMVVVLINTLYVEDILSDKSTEDEWKV